MKASIRTIALLSLASLAAAAAAAPSPPGAPAWVEGRNYEVVLQPQPTGLPPGKVLVTEVFSYACPACNQFRPYMQKLVKTLPPNAVVNYVPAAFNPAEDWPMFQLAYATAKALGVADRTHEAMFDAVWTTGELATTDPGTGALKSKMPTIEDAARFYQKQAGVPVATFLSASKSFGVDTEVRHDEDLMKAYGIDRTPTLIVNGKYRVTTQSAGGPEQVVDLVKFLVAKESK
ncbi:MAG TPA: thiol:disulfide interchange protein DsbA/DsbL [Steroidobacteraceae bacterium]|nr:thiol:disulfide interchange protein DsbA/DsbL [Steroidobacteraceae bacterium]